MREFVAWYYGSVETRAELTRTGNHSDEQTEDWPSAFSLQFWEQICAGQYAIPAHAEFWRGITSRWRDREEIGGKPSV